MKINKNIAIDWFITLVRISVGWHFLYEGYSKIIIDSWTSKGYLVGTTGFLSGFYHYVAESPHLLKVVDIMNIYGLCAIGLGLICGMLTRFAATGGALLLFLYYFAYPPFGASIYGLAEDNTFIVDRLFLEALILIWFIVINRQGYGLDNLSAFLKTNFSRKTKRKDSQSNIEGKPESRRKLLKNLAFLPALGVLGYGGFRHKLNNVDALSGATISWNEIDMGALNGEMPKGQIGKWKMSRLVAGGNLILGSSHARDLIYVNSLVKAYNTEKKIFETLMLAEKVGIDTINIGFRSGKLLAKYKKMTGSRLTVITQVSHASEDNNIFEQIDQAIDEGADIIQINGQCTDYFAEKKGLDNIVKMMDRIRNQGYMAGLGAHDVNTFRATQEYGIVPDYYMKTMHHDGYWSAHPRENRKPFETNGKRSKDHNRFHDNLFCVFPDQTIEFINQTKIPVMGFKVLAAGALTPEDGFRWAFEKGADFICVGMFDYQLIDDVNICIDILNNLKERKRDWYA